MKEYKFKINGKEYQVAIGEASGNMLSVNVNGADYQVELENMNAAAAAISAGAKKQADAPAEIAAASASSSASATASASAAAPAATGAGQTIKSPLPGIIISVDVKEGQAVKRGQKVAVVEAMKMENDILAECDGTVTAVHARKGDSVLEGADIVTIG